MCCSRKFLEIDAVHDAMNRDENIALFVVCVDSLRNRDHSNSEDLEISVQIEGVSQGPSES
jgi:hypothetical protein